MSIKVEIPDDNPAAARAASLLFAELAGPLKPSAAALQAPPRGYVGWGENVLRHVAERFGIDYTALVEEVHSVPPELDMDSAEIPAGQTVKMSGEWVGDGEEQTAAPANMGEEGTLTEDELVEDRNADRVDEKGVPFNVEFCAEAAKPFYGSGKTKGQWKKKRGVTDAAYNDWYAAALAAVPATEPGPVDTAAAFSQQDQGAAPVPTDIGGLMAWVSEMQAAERLASDDINAVYAELGLTFPADVFPSDVNTPDVIAPRIADLYCLLTQRATA